MTPRIRSICARCTPANYRTVTIELSPRGDQTEISLTQDHAGGEETRAKFEQNWRMILDALKKHLQR